MPFGILPYILESLGAQNYGILKNLDDFEDCQIDSIHFSSAPFRSVENSISFSSFRLRFWCLYFSAGNANLMIFFVNMR